jgi:hypothetical protein
MRSSSAVLACALVLLLPAGARAAGPESGTPGPIIRTSACCAGPLATAVAREAARTTLRVDLVKPQPIVQESRQRRSWIGRHPALFGALVGAGGGALVGAFAGHPESDEWFSRRQGLVLFGASVGAGGGAVAGWIVGLTRD